jgi:hypothetical protein
LSPSRNPSPAQAAIDRYRFAPPILRACEVFNAKIQPKLDQLRKAGMWNLIRQIHISVAKKLNDDASAPTCRFQICKKRFVRLKAIQQPRNLCGIPLIRDVALDAVSPARVPVVSREGSAFRRLPGISDPESMVSLQTKRCADVCRAQCWVLYQQFYMESSRRFLCSGICRTFLCQCSLIFLSA